MLPRRAVAPILLIAALAGCANGGVDGSGDRRALDRLHEAARTMTADDSWRFEGTSRVPGEAARPATGTADGDTTVGVPGVLTVALVDILAAMQDVDFATRSRDAYRFSLSRETAVDLLGGTDEHRTSIQAEAFLAGTRLARLRLELRRSDERVVSEVRFRDAGG